jgi:hypothetical protein
MPEATVQTTPEVGMPCTYGIGADAYAGVVTWVSPSRHQMRFCKVSGHTEHTGPSRMSDMGYTGCEQLATRRPDGKYRPAGANYGYIVLGVAREHRDPHF